ncbi:conserved hypothetical protein [Coccidioides posadasii str. Silveira]|uniref:Uncharacterized protein n=3 Tax=Coccidioides posadasii TaxID=199306 RepID=E9D063_COCPS|nr:conserved hypothetical protein [Coccidioides posadasii str. Silveira]KMM73122.1 hypothetical protein CPAG_09411 [Coccidioides posadasii RMSCC 3488]
MVHGRLKDKSEKKTGSLLDHSGDKSQCSRATDQKREMTTASGMADTMWICLQITLREGRALANSPEFAKLRKVWFSLVANLKPRNVNFLEIFRKCTNERPPLTRFSYEKVHRDATFTPALGTLPYYITAASAIPAPVLARVSTLRAFGRNHLHGWMINVRRFPLQAEEKG